MVGRSMRSVLRPNLLRMLIKAGEQACTSPCPSRPDTPPLDPTLLDPASAVRPGHLSHRCTYTPVCAAPRCVCNSSPAASIPPHHRPNLASTEAATMQVMQQQQTSRVCARRTEAKAAPVRPASSSRSAVVVKAVARPTFGSVSAAPKRAAAQVVSAAATSNPAETAKPQVSQPGGPAHMRARVAGAMRRQRQPPSNCWRAAAIARMSVHPRCTLLRSATQQPHGRPTHHHHRNPGCHRHPGIDLPDAQSAALMATATSPRPCHHGVAKVPPPRTPATCRRGRGVASRKHHHHLVVAASLACTPLAPPHTPRLALRPHPRLPRTHSSHARNRPLPPPPTTTTTTSAGRGYPVLRPGCQRRVVLQRRAERVAGRAAARARALLQGAGPRPRLLDCESM